MLLTMMYLAIGLCYGTVALLNGPTRVGRWTDRTGRARTGGALLAMPALLFLSLAAFRFYKQH